MVKEFEFYSKHEGKSLERIGNFIESFHGKNFEAVGKL
jgi:hypothetical protein